MGQPGCRWPQGRSAKSYVLPWEISNQTLAAVSMRKCESGARVSQFSADRRVEHGPWL